MPKVTFGYMALPRGEGDPSTQPFPSHNLMLSDAVRAEQLGYDAVWMPDHYYFERPSGIETFPEAWTLLTAIAMRTERLRLGTMVIAAGFRHPALMAKMAGALQELSGGRVVLGIGAGNQIHEHTAFGIEFERRIGKFKEYMAIMCALLNGETVTLDGRYYTLKGASLRTVVPRVPVLVAAGGAQMMDLTAKYASAWNPAGGVGWDPAAFSEKLGLLRSACAAVGRDASEIEVSHLSFMGVAADAAEAREITDYLAAQAKTTPEALLKRTLVGTPDQIATAMRGHAALGVTHFICAISGTPNPDRYMDRVELLAREVLPKVRG
ncbi:MAG: LLM class flavin-dependent oxidoreductase [Chloroflexota bacterium]